MSKKLINIIIGVAGLVIGFGTLASYDYFRPKKPTGIYYTNADKKDDKNDDLAVVFGKGQYTKLYLRNEKGELEDIEVVREREEQENETWYQKQLKKDVGNLEDIRIKLDKRLDD